MRERKCVRERKRLRKRERDWERGRRVWGREIECVRDKERESNRERECERKIEREFFEILKSCFLYAASCVCIMNIWQYERLLNNNSEVNSPRWLSAAIYRLWIHLFPSRPPCSLRFNHSRSTFCPFIVWADVLMLIIYSFYINIYECSLSLLNVDYFIFRREIPFSERVVELFSLALVNYGYYGYLIFW